MPVDISPLDRGAELYEEQLTRVCEGRLDVVHLGLGDDGHTASWPPDDPVVSSPQLVDVVRRFRGFDRLTLTPRTINAADVVAWLVVGSDKSHVLMDWEKRDPLLPSSVVRRDETDALFIDEQAGARR
jgi:6-phosphogluconolactonase/glucosamine-6-phosphate isomerase/deaminase